MFRNWLQHEVVAVAYFFTILAVQQLLPVHGYVSKCEKGGFKCSSCEKLIHCVETTNGIKSNVINVCDNSKHRYCSAEKGGCVDDIDVCQIFGQQTIKCQATGLFPDPFDCNSYHMCKEENGLLFSTKYNCPEDRSYDPLATTCRFKTTHRVCIENPIEKCKKPLQNGPLPENPNMYYVCVQNEDRLEPWLYKCKANHIYENHACIQDTSKIVTFTCNSVGNFPDPNDRSRYFECDIDLKLIHKTCRPGTYFVEKEKSCVKE